MNARILSMQNRKSDRQEHHLSINSPIKKLGIRLKEGISFIAFEEIQYCEANGNYCFIHLRNGEKILASKTLKMISTFLPEHTFVRIHQSYFINIHEVRNFNREVILKNGICIPYSRTRKQELHNALERIATVI